MADTFVNIVGSILGAVAAALVGAYFNRRKADVTRLSEIEETGDVRAPNIESLLPTHWVLIALWPLVCSVPEAGLLYIGDDWTGVSIGIAQTLLLRTLLGRTCSWVGWWLLASMAAWFVMWYTAWFLMRLPFTQLGLVYGISAGVFQWFVLRGHFWNSGWWILASSLGWSFGFVIGSELHLPLFRGDQALAVGFFVAGMITAWPLDYILRHPINGDTLGSERLPKQRRA